MLQCGTLAAMSMQNNPRGNSRAKDSSGDLARSAARGYVKASRSFRDAMANVPAPDVTFAEVARERRDAFLSAELPDVPFSGIALTPAEKEVHYNNVGQRLRESTNQMRELVAYERRLVETSRTVKEAVAFSVAAIAVFAASIGIAFVCHVVAAGILN